MLLCIDIGNTNIVLGIFEQDVLKHTFRLETKALRTEDEYGIRIIENLKYNDIKKEDLEGAIISSVVPEVDAIFEKAMLKYFNIKPVFVGPGIKTGVKVNIDNPKQLGADLLVGAVAAANKYGFPCIIIDMGTATTISVVNDKKEFIGGVIYPGVIAAYSSLIKATSLLESTKIGVPTNVIGRDTMSSMQSGMVFGTAGAINGLVDRIKKEYGEMKVIATGGVARHIVLFLDDVIYDENLLMEGLKIVYYKNEKEV